MQHNITLVGQPIRRNVASTQKSSCYKIQVYAQQNFYMIYNLKNDVSQIRLLLERKLLTLKET